MPILDPVTTWVESARARRRHTAASTPKKLSTGLRIEGIADHLVMLADRVIAWYVAEPVGWSFRTDHAREQAIMAAATRWAELTGRRVHWRVTSRPWPVEQWARDHHANAPAPLPGFADHLAEQQYHLYRTSPADKIVYYGVQVIRRSGIARTLSQASSVHATKEAAFLFRETDKIDTIMTGFGLGARPAAPVDMAYLLRRSVGLGLPAPLHLSAPHGRWDRQDIAGLQTQAQCYAEPYDPHVTVVGIDDRGNQVQRFVRVLSMGRMAEMETPQRDEPWMSKSDALPFPIEWSAIFDIPTGHSVVADMQRQVQRIAYQREHWESDHGMAPPLSLARQSEHARRVSDEMQHGFAGASTRCRGWIRAAVSGATVEELDDRAAKLRDLYAPAIEVSAGFEQWAKAREFLPGAEVRSTAHLRRFSVQFLAAAVPARAAMVGDRRGVYVGPSTSSARRPVMCDPWYGPEVLDTSSLIPLSGGLGSGKSALMGKIVYCTVLQGTRWVLLDPSGPLARLCEVSRIADRARHVDLLGGRPGLLSPYLVVPEPTRGNYPTATEYAREIIKTEATRRALARDVIVQLLPTELARDRACRKAILQATSAVGGKRSTTLDMVLDQLRTVAAQGSGPVRDAAGDVVEYLADIADLPQMQLIFPAPEEDILDTSDAGPLLTVLTMRGLTLPKETDSREEYSEDERFGLCLLSLAFWLTHRAIYEGDMNARKGIGIDEAHFLTALSTGRTLTSRLSHDSRKYNAAVLVASQVGVEVLRAGVASLTGSAFVGRTTDDEAQKEGLRLLKVPTGMGYEQVLGALSPLAAAAGQGRPGPRQFVFADAAEHVDTITIDLNDVPELKKALDTTPTGGLDRQTRTGPEGRNVP